MEFSLFSAVFFLDKTFDIESIKGIFFQVVMLLGVAIVIYLYINFKSNRKKGNQRRRFELNGSSTSNEVESDVELLDYIPVPITIIGKNERVISANLYFKALFKDIADRIEGRTLDYFWPKDTYDILTSMLGKKSIGHKKTIEINQKSFLLHLELTASEEYILTLVPQN